MEKFETSEYLCMKVSWLSYWWLVIFCKLLCVQLSRLPKCWLMRE